MKHISARGAVLVLLMAGLGAAVSAETVRDFEYKTNGSGAAQTIEITKYKGSAAQVAIPDKIDGLPVTRIYGSWNNGAFNGAFKDNTSLKSVTIPSSVTSLIEARAFSGCTGLTGFIVDRSNPNYTSVNGILFSRDQKTLITYPGGKQGAYTIPESVTSIEWGAFFGCRSLTSVTIPESVTSIGGEAFSGCSSLTSVTIPESVTSIGGEAFSGCSSLTSVTIPNSITYIGESAFSGCSSLTSVTIPSSVTSIGDWAFSGCSSLTSVTIPNSITYIGESAFSGCSSLTSVTIPSSVTSIRHEAFFGCSSLTSVTIPNSITEIGILAFSGCSSLTSVTIPSSVTSIEPWAFSGCRRLTSVTIPSSVTSIGERAFSGCRSLTSVTVDQRNPNYTSVNGILFSKDQKTLITYPGGKQGAYTIPNSVTSIENGAFTGCRSLTNVTIPSSVASIEPWTFYECSSLTSVTLSRRTAVGRGAFPAGAQIRYSD